MIRNPHAVARLSRSMIQRVPRGATPSRTITAPEPCQRADLITEAERQAYFERSRTFHATPANTADPSPLGQGAVGVASSSESAS